jgi:hypothetical protein
MLYNADLRGADLHDPNLSLTTLRSAALRGANLAGAQLSSADLSGADLRSADLTGATLFGTTFADTWLTGTKGLVSCNHLAPSSIGIDTMFKSGGTIPEAFSGVHRGIDSALRQDYDYLVRSFRG